MTEQKTTPSPEEVAAELDRDARPQDTSTGRKRTIISVIAVAWSLYHLYTGFMGIMAPGIPHENSFVAFHLTFGLVLVFLVHPLLPATAPGAGWGRMIDLALVLLALVSVGYLGANFVDIQMRNGALAWWEYILGALAMLVLLEGSRRAIGAVVPVIAIAFLLYAYFGNYIPGPLGHRGYSLQRIIDANYVLWDGILGVLPTRRPSTCFCLSSSPPSCGRGVEASSSSISPRQSSAWCGEGRRRSQWSPARSLGPCPEAPLPTWSAPDPSRSRS